MGLTNSPSTFAHVMNNVFKDLLGKSVLIYLDDILVFSKTPEEHVRHVKEVMEVLRAHKLYAKLTKCEFGKQKLAFMGHVVSAEGIQRIPRRLSWLRSGQPLNRWGMFAYSWDLQTIPGNSSKGLPMCVGLSTYSFGRTTLLSGQGSVPKHSVS